MYSLEVNVWFYWFYYSNVFRFFFSEKKDGLVSLCNFFLMQGKDLHFFLTNELVCCKDLVTYSSQKHNIDKCAFYSGLTIEYVENKVCQCALSHKVDLDKSNSLGVTFSADWSKNGSAITDTVSCSW